MHRVSRWALGVFGASLLAGCGSDESGLGDTVAGTGGFPQAGGGVAMYETGGTAGLVGAGGIVAAGGAPAGGSLGSGGLFGTGGLASTGGAPASGGTLGTGGVPDAGPAGATASGGAGASGAGGSAGTGGGGAGGTQSSGGAGGGAGTGGRGTADASIADASSDGAGLPDSSATDAGAAPVCSIVSPKAIALTGSQGTVSGSASGDTSDGVSRVGPAACDGTTAGAGPDLSYSFTLDRTRDVTVSVTAGFDAILRTYTVPCTAPLNEPGGDACANAGTGSEQMVFPGLGAGTYYVVVDGAGAADKGTFTVNVKAVCNGVDQIRLVELGIGTTDYVVIRNTSDCPADIGGMKVLFDDSVAADLTTTLPSMTLAPGAELRIQENLGASVPGAIDAGGSIPFQFDRGGTVRLCKGDCANPAVILDVLMFADGDTTTLEPPPPPPSPVTFSGPVTGITQANQDSKSWVRVGTGGRNPTFFGSDWCTGDPGAVFGLKIDEVFVGEPDYFAIKNHADCVVNLSPFRATIVGGGSTVNAVMDNRSVVVAGRVFVSEPPAQSQDINVGVDIPLAGGSAGSVQLCRGACSIAGNTIDAVAFDGVGLDGGVVPYPPLPSGMVFFPGGLTAVTEQNQNTTSYFRKALAGEDPRFLASDWTTGAKSR